MHLPSSYNIVVLTLVSFCFGCTMMPAKRRDESTVNAAQTPISVSLTSAESSGIFIFDPVQRRATQIKAITSDGTQMKYSFAKRDDAYEFVYSPEGGQEKGLIRRFSFDRASLSSSASATLGLGSNGFFNGPSFCARQNKVAYVTVNSDSTAVSALNLSGPASAEILVAGPNQLSADLSCENTSEGIAYAHYGCSSNNLAACAASENTLASIVYAAPGVPATRITFPDQDPRIIQSPARPIDNHLGDVDPRVLSGPQGNFLVFQRIFTTPSLFSNGAPIESDFGHNGFMESYYKEIGDFRSPKQREFRLDFNAWVVSHYPEDRRETVAVESVMGTSDIQILEDRPNTVDIVIGASMKSTAYEYNGILRGQFDRSPATEGETIHVQNISSIVETREFACAVWRSTGGAIDRDGNIYLFLMQFPRLMEGGRLITFAARKIKVLPNTQIPIIEIGGAKFLTINGENISVERWQSLFCS